MALNPFRQIKATVCSLLVSLFCHIYEYFNKVMDSYQIILTKMGYSIQTVEQFQEVSYLYFS